MLEFGHKIKHFGLYPAMHKQTKIVSAPATSCATCSALLTICCREQKLFAQYIAQAKNSLGYAINFVQRA